MTPEERLYRDMLDRAHECDHPVIVEGRMLWLGGMCHQCNALLELVEEYVDSEIVERVLDEGPPLRAV